MTGHIAIAAISINAGATNAYAFIFSEDFFAFFDTISTPFLEKLAFPTKG